MLGIGVLLISGGGILLDGLCQRLALFVGFLLDLGCGEVDRAQVSLKGGPLLLDLLAKSPAIG